MEKREKKLFPLSRKVALTVIAIVVSLSTLLITLSYYHYRTEMFGHYERFAMNIASVAATQLDPDKIDTWLSTGEKDEDYEKSFDVLCDIREKGGIEYLYVVKPELDEVWYVMDTDPTEGAIPLGYHEPYYEGAFAENAEKMARGEEVGPLVSNEEYGWLMSVYYPLRTSSGEPAGYVGADILMNDVVNDLHDFAKQMIMLMALMAAAFSFVLIRSTTKNIVEPISRISRSAEQLVEEERSRSASETSIFSQLTIKSNDEVGILYESLSKMEQDVNNYIRELLQVTAEKERIGAELNVATQIQADMLPNIFPPFPERREFQIFATMNPAKEVGGDFYDFFLVDKNHLCMVMADVSGKGVPAALFMVIAKTLLKNRAMMGDSPSEILYNVNNQLCDGNKADLFVTVWLAIIDTRTGRGVAANAGHEHPVLCRKGGKYELVEYRHSPAVAAIEEMKFREHCFEMEPGDRLFVYTDGVPEATDANNGMFGAERMLRALNEDPESPPEELLPRVKREIDEFVGGAPQFDDITMLGFYYKGPEHEKIHKLKLEAKLENLDRVLDFLDPPMNNVRFSPKARFQLRIAVEELFVNIANYAYESGTGQVNIIVREERHPDALQVTLVDSGIPYNPLEKPDPDVSLSAEERKIGGLGIYMVKKSMDGMEYERSDGKNILTIRKEA